MRLVGDARETLETLTDAVVSRDLSKRSKSRSLVEKRIAKAWNRFENDRAIYVNSEASPIRPERILAEVRKYLDGNTIVVADASYSSNWVAGQLRTTSPRTRIITPRGLAGLGWGFPLAVGAKLGRPSTKVIVVVGDGGFAHSWAELETAKRSQVSLTVIVLNNGVLGYQKDAEQMKLGAYTSSGHLGFVDHAAIAVGMRS
jgi:acetolactate synthase-1/2/3 large subunit